MKEHNSETFPYSEMPSTEEKECVDFIPNNKSMRKEKKNMIKKVKENKLQKDETTKNAGRNSTSNIFRVFIKLCSKEKF